MAKNPESLLVSKLQNRIGEVAPGAFLIKLADRFTRGLPDLLLIGVTKSGAPRVLAIEVKTPTGVVSAIQTIIGDRINKLGAQCHGAITWRVVRSVAELDALLNEAGL